MRTIPTPFSSFPLYVLLCLALAGCASGVGSNVKISEENVAKYDSLTVEESVAAFEQRINQAKQADMPLLAPDYYREASKLLSDTQALVAKKKTTKAEIVGQIAKGDALLDKGQRIMVLVRKSFTRELELKGLLDQYHTATIYPKDYENVMEDLSDLIEKVELDKADKIDKPKAELIKAMEALDVKTMQHTALHDSDVINQATKEKGGEKLAPATFTEATRVYQDAMQGIAAAPHDLPTVNKGGEEAMFAARHAQHITERVLALQKQFKTPVEELVLQEENRLLSISTTLDKMDLRDQPIEKQAEIIAATTSKFTQYRDAKQQAENQLGSAGDQIKDLEKRLKEATDAQQRGDAQLHTKEQEIINLNTRITLLEKENQFLGQQLLAQQPVTEPTTTPVNEAEPTPAAAPTETTETANPAPSAEAAETSNPAPAEPVEPAAPAVETAPATEAVPNPSPAPIEATPASNSGGG